MLFLEPLKSRSSFHGVNARPRFTLVLFLFFNPSPSSPVFVSPSTGFFFSTEVELFFINEAIPPSVISSTGWIPGERYSLPCFGNAIGDAVPLYQKNSMVKSKLIGHHCNRGWCRIFNRHYTVQ